MAENSQAQQFWSHWTMYVQLKFAATLCRSHFWSATMTHMSQATLAQQLFNQIIFFYIQVM
jgi:hypothetical protein